MMIVPDSKQPLSEDADQPPSPSATSTSSLSASTITTGSESPIATNPLSSPLTSNTGPCSPRNDLRAQGQQPLVSTGSESADLRPSVPFVPDEPPPEFAPYKAEAFEVGNKDVVSHDPHLNTDGEALYRFLLAQSESLPSVRINFHGKHQETRYRSVLYTDDEGRQRTRQESHLETITDFDFCIDVYPAHLKAFAAAQQEAGPTSSAANDGFAFSHWSVADDEPVYRGGMVRECETLSESLRPLDSSKRTRAKRKEIKKYEEWVKRRNALGYPPWFREDDQRSGQSSPAGSTLRSTKTLREWADEYCASEKFFKEFVYDKIMYGWDFNALKQSLTSLIKNTPYNGTLSITFTPHNSKIYIRSSNWVSRMLSNKWVKILSIVLLVFPFVWLFKRFHSRGGGRWEVCGGAYPLKKVVDIDENGRRDVVRDQQAQVQDDELPSYDDLPIEAPLTTFANARYTSAHPLYNPAYPAYPSRSFPTVSALSQASSNAHPTSGPRSISSTSGSSSQQQRIRVIRTPTGLKKLYGIREGEWFRAWEGVITRAVVGRYQSTEPLQSVDLRPNVGFGLDGY